MLSFENESDTTLHSEYFLPKVEIKDYNVETDGRNFFDQPINNDIKTLKKLLLVKEIITQLVVS